MSASARMNSTVEELQFAIRRSRRRSIELIIERDGSITVRAPKFATASDVSKFVREKRMWVYGKLAEREMLGRQTARKEFVTGEGFSYLGRTYRLRLVDRQDRPLKLLNGRFLLARTAQPEARNHFIRWYQDHSAAWLAERAKYWAERMALRPGSLHVRDLGSRWGSCGKGDRLNFHWALMTLPRNAIDYIIVHELAHIQAPAHNKKFWSTVERTMPDYKQRKSWIDQHGGLFANL
jgi:predicted metal-dependent hydrolase